MKSIQIYNKYTADPNTLSRGIWIIGQQPSLTLWFVFNRSSHPFLMRLRSLTPKSSSDAGGMTDGNDAQNPAHTHRLVACTHTFLSEGEYFFMCWFHMSVHNQSYSRNMSSQPKQCQDRNAESTPHYWQEKGKEIFSRHSRDFSCLIGHSTKVKLVIQSLAFSHNVQALSPFLIIDHIFMLCNI